MKYIEKYKIDNDELNMTILNKNIIKLSFVNALRRIILSEIPIYILDDIEFYHNNTSLNNEYLIRRLRLLPVINKNTDKYDNINIELNIKNNNEDEYIKTIYVSDFKVNNSLLKIDNIIKYPKILFTKLKTGNHIHFKCNIKKDIALNKGSAYCPINIMTIKFEKDEKKIKQMLKNIKDPIKKDNFIKYDSNRIYLKNNKDEPMKYNITLEASGAMTIKDILLNSLDVLENKLENTSKNLKSNDGELLTINEQKSTVGGLDFVFKNENDTLGNLLSSYLLDEKDVIFSSYKIPHPLINEMIIRLTLKEQYKLKDYKHIIEKVIVYIKSIITDIRKEFSSIS